MRRTRFSNGLLSSTVWPMADNLQYTGTQYTNRKARMSVHSHEFNEGNPLAERRTRWAVVLTAVMMVVEIAGGWTYNSMALLADRSEERRVGKECVSTGGSRGSRDH